MINSFFSKQFILFLMVGSSCAAINIFSRLILNLNFSYSTSVIIAFCIGFCLAFFLNFKYVFPGSSKPILQQMRNFFLINLFFLPIVWISSITLQGILIDLTFFPTPNLIAHIFSVSIPIFFSFLIYKFSVFTK